MARALSLHLPTWSIDLARRRLRRRERESGPREGGGRRGEVHYLLTTDVAQRRLVDACCAASARAGVRPGMDLAHARALLPTGLVWAGAYQPERDAEALRALAAWATRFSPLVAPDPPDGLLLDISGCERVFRGEARLVNSAAEALERLGFAVRAAAAPTFGCAWAIARFGRRERSMVPDGCVREAMGPLPVEALRILPEASAALREVGVECVEHVLALPRAMLPVRFGHELLLRVDQAFGRAMEVIEPVRPVEPARVERVFDGPTTQYEAIELTARDLVAGLCKELLRRESGARRIELTLKRVDDAPVVLGVALGRPNRSAEHLWSLLRPHVERANLGFGVEEMSLVATRAGRLRHEQVAAIGGSADEVPVERAVGELADVLANRLGPDRLACVELVESHMPERAFRFESGTTLRAVSLPKARALHHSGQDRDGATRHRLTGDAAVPRGWRIHRPQRDDALAHRLEADATGWRPSVLFERPESAAAVAITPDGPPSMLRWRGRDHSISVAIGPERIAGEWWRFREPTRDYFKVQTAGRWLWVYREVQTNQWFVHGEWA